MMSFKQIISTILLITCIAAPKEANAMRGFVGCVAILGIAALTTTSIAYCGTSPEDRGNKAQEIITTLEADNFLSLVSTDLDGKDTRELILASNYSEEEAEEKILELHKQLETAQNNLRLAARDSEKIKNIEDLTKRSSNLQIKIESVLFNSLPEKFWQLSPYCDQ